MLRFSPAEFARPVPPPRLPGIAPNRLPLRQGFLRREEGLGEVNVKPCRAEGTPDEVERTPRQGSKGTRVRLKGHPDKVDETSG